jgi:hypothetical protein
MISPTTNVGSTTVELEVGSFARNYRFVNPGSGSQVDLLLKQLDIASDESHTVPIPERIAQPIYYSLEMPLRIDRFNSLQKWEGHVLRREGGSFIAVLIDLTNPSTVEEEAEIPIEEIEPDDRELVVPGAVFYWNIGYYDKTSGRQRTSLIRFRRLPHWTREEIEFAAARGEQLRDSINALTSEQ